ncbi:aggregation-promoting factor C-terminal-like domain-containing protein [Kitasatospora griseola]|uniref:aggregation-promoting factor C-terminal-like domain-containing protein n=1 Tax=Kitasatospora griseola TaxID=2064 RepID=UPI00364E395C
MPKHRTPSLSGKFRRHRRAVVTGVATLAVAGASALAVALPQHSTPAEAAARPASASDQQLATDALASQAAAEASASASASASAQAEAEAKARAEAEASASAGAQAEASASASASAQAKASAEAKARAEAASRDQQRQALPTGKPAASASAPPLAKTYSGTPQQIAAQIVPAGQLQCFNNIVERESGWNVHATNASSGAYGLMQALPGSKMASVGADWRDNPATQIKWGLQYMNQTYGSPCAAWSFWQSHNWY